MTQTSFKSLLLATTVSLGVAMCPFSHSRAQAKADGDVWEGAIPASTDKSDPFVAANSAFHGWYSDVGAALRPDSRLLVEGDYLVMEVQNASGVFRTVNPYTPMHYHDLKMVAHMPFSAFLILYPTVATAPNKTALIPLTSDVRDKLQGLVSTVRTMHDNCSVASTSRFRNDTVRVRQLQILDDVTEFCNQALKAGRMSLAILQAYTLGQSPILNLNTQEAAQAQVDSLLALIREYRSELESRDLWASTRVVVTSSHMARPGSLVAQTFARYFDVNVINNERFITLEGIHSEEAALSSLDTHITDYATGRAFFGWPYRMHEDLLCAAAKQRLDQLFPASAHNATGCPFKKP